MKKTVYFIAAALLVLAACTKPEKPCHQPCSEEVTLAGKHICNGYLLLRSDGSYLRTFDYAPNTDYEAILAKSTVGDMFVIGYGQPRKDLFDCQVVDTTYSKRIKLECLEQVTDRHK